MRYDFTLPDRTGQGADQTGPLFASADSAANWDRFSTFCVRDFHLKSLTVTCLEHPSASKSVMFRRDAPFLRVMFGDARGDLSPYKLRVSVAHHAVPDAFNILFDVLFHSVNVQEYKIFDSRLIEDHLARFEHSTQFTIYLCATPGNEAMQPDPRHTRLLIDQIDGALRAGGIAQSPATPECDVRITSYVSGRCDQIVPEGYLMRPPAQRRVCPPRYVSATELQRDPVLRQQLQTKFDAFVMTMMGARGMLPVAEHAPPPFQDPRLKRR